MNPSGQTTPAPLNLSAGEIVSYIGLGLTALGLGALGGKAIGEAVSHMRHSHAAGGLRDNPRVSGYIMPPHYQRGYSSGGSHYPGRHVKGHHVHGYSR